MQRGKLDDGGGLDGLTRRAGSLALGALAPGDHVRAVSRRRNEAYRRWNMLLDERRTHDDGILLFRPCADRFRRRARLYGACRRSALRARGLAAVAGPAR